MTNKEKAYLEIEKLVNRFAEQENFYKQPTYNETETRRDFIDPFFTALGWDVENKKGLLPTEREVHHEINIDTKKGKKTADYSFHINGKIQFYVEAKKPTVFIKEDPKPAIQLRNYGWNSKLNISILTDFEEFSIYDCTKKIRDNDKASKNRIKFIQYKDYLKEFDFLYDTFSYNSVIEGSLEQFAKKNINDREKETVDKEFLKSLETWRKYLATNVAQNNKQLDEEEINYSVQQTIDRIVFLKICEDREVELSGTLKNCIKKGNFYNNLFEYFKTADQKYNSGIFDFKKDTITTLLKIDNKIIKNIIDDFDEIGYDFSKIPIEILGFAYEQFLGKVIKLEKSGHAVIETKPEVRKAGGVFYTPEYIVEYIVKNTIGKLIENKTPEEISKIKILDPSCGSGSFLLGAYQFLLNYHQNYYIKNHKGKITKDSSINQDGTLKTSEKKRILVNNIFGVDIDMQAVEVTKLSLLIKAMEGETTSTIEASLKLFHQRVLPNLDNNILCGNSLVGSDFYDNEIDFNFKLEKRIKSFDWKSGFKSIIEYGGFDVIIGNPPYVDSEEMVKTHKEEREYCSKQYACAKGNWDLYCVFIEKSIKLLHAKGICGLIIPNKFLSVPYGDYLKSFISNYFVENITDYSSVPVFVSFDRKINVYPIVLIVKKLVSNKKSIYIKVKETDKKIDIEYQNTFTIKKDEVNWTQKFSKDVSLIEKIIEKSVLISKYFLIENAASVSDAYKIKEILIDKQDFSEKYFKFINTGTIDKYNILWGLNKTQYIKDAYQFPVIEKNVFNKNFPIRYKQATSEKLIGAGMIKNLEFIYDNGEIIAGKSTSVILCKSNKYSLKYLLGLLNSNLVSFLYRNLFKNNSMSGGYLNVSKKQLENFYFCEIDIEKKSEKNLYESIIAKADELILLFNELNTKKLETQKQLFQRRIEVLYSQINQAVYQLYNLTPEEIEIIEKNAQ